ncbi:unnamed protein product [Vitrella brassicaformis CCMP3155]|uniref:Uncharacterized protein n=1 Tax=Vitrella brassicaformis (strain CCMP3155) TaxID=1169540 RepID=A0A0G4GVF5_VITBC|nr:unnamed protein product [Vitrella brassicaformis CCMP3155]|eukprot:CEM34883.1 unnamed protein product [Vitrella brassicaformis CCMP3155]
MAVASEMEKIKDNWPEMFSNAEIDYCKRLALGTYERESINFSLPQSSFSETGRTHPHIDVPQYISTPSYQQLDDALKKVGLRAHAPACVGQRSGINQSNQNALERYVKKVERLETGDLLLIWGDPEQLEGGAAFIGQCVAVHMQEEEVDVWWMLGEGKNAGWTANGTFEFAYRKVPSDPSAVEGDGRRTRGRAAAAKEAIEPQIDRISLGCIGLAGFKLTQCKRVESFIREWAWRQVSGSPEKRPDDDEPPDDELL